ncbi:hypothetical protein BHM03_00004472 [Ensete ventricosum]|uniref:Uncharacterized protein n=1 Tax=Ensete ventricosum TaxID=4639 RepID=A0A445MAM4_ENSVE|nr:hypothetical protein BHM03_00004472 [Ensete ventricosum]
MDDSNINHRRIRSPSSHRGKSTLICGHDKSVACSSFSGGFSLRSKLSPRCDLLGLGDQPNLNSTKSARSLSSIRISNTSNFASIRSFDVMANDSRSIILRSFFCCRVKGMDQWDELVAERDKDQG